MKPKLAYKFDNKKKPKPIEKNESTNLNEEK